MDPEVSKEVLRNVPLGEMTETTWLSLFDSFGFEESTPKRRTNSNGYNHQKLINGSRSYRSHFTSPTSSDMPDFAVNGKSLPWSRSTSISRNSSPSPSPSSYDRLYRGPTHFFNGREESPGPNPGHNHEILQMMAKVLRKFEEVSKKHAERLRFLDPELESTNTRIEVLETLIRANDERFMGYIEKLDAHKLREILKIKESKIVSSKFMSKTHVKEIHKMGNEDFHVDEGTNGEPEFQHLGDEGFFQIDHIPTAACKNRECKNDKKL